jgi:polyisoprenyl-teichoic acid--peptidoglycan teichoic acid transferase
MVEDRRSSVVKRFLIGAALVVFAAASATAVAAFHEVDKVVNALKSNPRLALGQDLTPSSAGEPQTLMLLGSDKRPKNSPDPQAEGARSDTIMLVRLDPSKKAIALMSLPRDLRVTIPGHGIAKLNGAYDLGGPKLTLETVKHLTGLQINHVVNVDFRGFWAAVDAIGCVYADIDRRYYNDTPGFAYINIEPGYQHLCGRQALQYVRYRHEDNDIVRSARQQDFLRQAKQQIATSALINDRDRLLKIFGHYTTSDIRSRKEVIRLIKLAVYSADEPIREIHFRASVGPSYVTASHARIHRLVDRFLGLESSHGPRGTLPAKRGAKRSSDLGLENAGAAGKDQAAQAVHLGAGGKLPVFYPVMRTAGALYAGPPRVYAIRSPDGKRYPAYRMVIKRGEVGEYYGVQGTTWKNPPILGGSFVSKKVGNRILELHFDGDRLRLVAWHTPKAAYWVSNTLLLSLSNRQMLAIARSARSV